MISGDALETAVDDRIALIAVEDEALGTALEKAFVEIHRAYERLHPEELVERTYPDRYWIALETGKDIEKLKLIAKHISDLWGKRIYSGWLDNIDFVYFLSFINDEILPALWGIAGWEASSIVSNDTILARRVVIQDFVDPDRMRFYNL